MITQYINKAGKVRTQEEWLRRGTEFYEEMALPLPKDLWGKIVKVLKLQEVQVVDLGDFLDVPEANKNLFKMTARDL